MRILQYSQHVLGMGHFFRSLELAGALKDHQLTMVTGGEPVRAAIPAHVSMRQLPPLMMDADFGSLKSGGELEAIQAQRKKELLNILEEVRPDAFLVEMYPFGRRKFGFELLPALEAIREGRFGKVRVLCSLRDILVEKPDQAAFEDRVLSVLNAYFHGLLVHSDPQLVRLDETFARTGEIAAPVAYTGYIAPKREAEAGQRLRESLKLGQEPLVLASAGGGSVGHELLASAIQASMLLHTHKPHRLLVFSGPFMGAPEFGILQRLAQGCEWIRVERFTPDFPAHLSAADLSVSLAGYNTVMALLAAGTPGLVLPFDQNREQRMRAERIERRGVLQVLDHAGLDAPSLAHSMSKCLENGNMGRPVHGIDLAGAAKTAEIIEEWCGHA